MSNAVERKEREATLHTCSPGSGSELLESKRERTKRSEGKKVRRQAGQVIRSGERLQQQCLRVPGKSFVCHSTPFLNCTPSFFNAYASMPTIWGRAIDGLSVRTFQRRQGDALTKGRLLCAAQHPLPHQVCSRYRPVSATFYVL